MIGTALVDRATLRFGSISAIAGAVIALLANLLHPRISRFDDPTAAFVREVAGFDAWIPLHLALVASILLIAAGQFVFLRTLKGGPADGLARLALGALLVSTPIALVTLGIDGYAEKVAADAFAAGPSAATFAPAAAIGHVSWGMFMLLILTFVGLTPILLGLAVTRSDDYPTPLGWGAVLFGAGAIVAGLIGLGGQSGLFWGLFLATSGPLTVWVLILGVLLWRRAAEARPSLPVPPATSVRRS
jgi:hypothetical protein